MALVLVVLSSMTSFAASIDLAGGVQLDKPNRTATISGTVTSPVASQQVTILVLKKTASLSSLSDDDIVYIDQAAAGTDGSFSFSAKVDAAKGDEFVAYLGGSAVTSVASQPLNFVANRPGDTNGDDIIDIEDYQKVLSNFGKASFDPAADLNSDGVVDIEDYQAVLSNFGK